MDSGIRLRCVNQTKPANGCGRIREIGHCDGGCRGLPIALDDYIKKY